MFVLRDNGKVLRHDLGPELDINTRNKILFYYQQFHKFLNIDLKKLEKLMK